MFVTENLNWIVLFENNFFLFKFHYLYFAITLFCITMIVTVVISLMTDELPRFMVSLNYLFKKKILKYVVIII